MISEFRRKRAKLILLKHIFRTYVRFGREKKLHHWRILIQLLVTYVIHFKVTRFRV